MTIETFTLTGKYYADDPRGFIDLIPSQTVIDAPGDAIVAGTKIHVPLVTGTDGGGTYGAFSHGTLPTGIGYTPRVVQNSGYPDVNYFTVAPGTVILDMADVTTAYTPPLTPTELDLAKAYTDAAIAASSSFDGGSW